jgi:hypothetical protein
MRVSEAKAASHPRERAGFSIAIRVILLFACAGARICGICKTPLPIVFP